MFGALIKEISNSAFLYSENDFFYIKDENGVYNSKFQELVSLEKNDTPYFFDGQFWLSDYYADESLSKDNKEVKPFFFNNLTLFINNHFYRIKSRKVHGLEQYNLSGELINKIEGRLRYLAQSKKLLFCRGRTDLLAYDFDLNEKWKVTTQKRCFSGVPNSLGAPQYYQPSDLIIINFGEHNTPERGEFEINAYQAETGELVWQQIVSTSPSCSHLSGDKVYVCVEDELIILSAATGEVLHRVKHQLNEPKDDYPAVNFMYPYQDKLLLVSPKHGLVQLRTGDGKTILQNIHVPLPYTTTFHPPVIENDQVYFSLTHANSFDNTMKGGVLVLTQDGSVVGNADNVLEATIEPRPPIEIALVKTDSGEDVYHVSIKHDNLDEIIRFSTIALKEVAFKYGNSSLTTDTNKDHRGKLLLSVNRQYLDMSNEELLQRLSIIKQRVENNLMLPKLYAGDGKSDFTVDIELM